MYNLIRLDRIYELTFFVNYLKGTPDPQPRVGPKDREIEPEKDEDDSDEIKAIPAKHKDRRFWMVFTDEDLAADWLDQEDLSPSCHLWCKDQDWEKLNKKYLQAQKEVKEKDRLRRILWWPGQTKTTKKTNNKTKQQPSKAKKQNNTKP